MPLDKTWTTRGVFETRTRHITKGQSSEPKKTSPDKSGGFQMTTMTLPNIPIPPSLDSQNFRDAWAEWVEFRMSLKKVKRWDLMFNRQLIWLSSMPIPMAIAIIDQSIRQGWQGLFEIKTPPRPYLDPKNGIVEHTSKHTKMKELELVEAQLKEIRGRASESALEVHYEPADIEPRRLLIARKKALKAELGYTK